mgnify:CR=1 FL=1
MKKINLILLIFITVFFAACEADKETATLLDSVTPNTMGTITSPLVLALETKGDSVKFSWTAVDYGIPVAQAYTLQVDKAGNNFASSQDLVTVNALKAGLTQGELNKVLLNLVEGGVSSAVEFRVKTVINKSINPVYSSVATVTVTPYQTSFPPIYMIGSATGGWDPALAVEMPSSAPNVYTTIAYFSNVVDNNTFRFFKQAGWGDAWNCPYFTGGFTTTLLENALDGDSNFRFIGTTGYYRITANLSAKTVVMVAVDEPVMFMTGDGVGSGAWGWDPGQYVKMTWKRDGVWESTTNFNNGGAFRFFAQTGWSTSYNYPYFDGGTVTALLENANDGDKNFRVVAATGTYKITVNLPALTVSMAPGK